MVTGIAGANFELSVNGHFGIDCVGGSEPEADAVVARVVFPIVTFVVGKLVFEF